MYDRKTVTDHWMIEIRCNPDDQHHNFINVKQIRWYNNTTIMPKNVGKRGGKGKGAGKASANETCESGDCNACADCFERIRGMVEHLKKEVERAQTERDVAMAKEGALRERIELVTAERDRLNVDLEQKNVRKNSAGKMRWKIRHASGEDKPAGDVVHSLCKNCFFPNEKFLPAGWHHPNDNDRSMYTMVMRLITPPNGKTKEDYWTNLVSEWVNYKYQTLKRQAATKIRDKVFGK